MTLTEKLLASLDEEIGLSRERFTKSLNTDENVDYRRGFLAGELFARLHFKCAFIEMMDNITKKPTD